MKAFVLAVTLLLMVPLSSADASQDVSVPNKEDMVYICTGPQSNCYHRTPGCHGLNKCSGDIRKVSKKEAEEKYRRRACKICYK